MIGCILCITSVEIKDAVIVAKNNHELCYLSTHTASKVKVELIVVTISIVITSTTVSQRTYSSFNICL